MLNKLSDSFLQGSIQTHYQASRLAHVFSATHSSYRTIKIAACVGVLGYFGVYKMDPEVIIGGGFALGDEIIGLLGQSGDINQHTYNSSIQSSSNDGPKLD